MGAGVDEKSLYLPQNFAVNLKLLKSKIYLKTLKYLKIFVYDIIYGFNILCPYFNGESSCNVGEILFTGTIQASMAPPLVLKRPCTK